MSTQGRTLKTLNFLAMGQHGIVLLMFSPMVPSLMETFAVRESLAGLLLSVGSLGFVAGPILAGAVIDERGMKVAFGLGFAVEIAFFVVFGLAPVFWVAAAANFVIHMAAAFVETSANVMPTLVARDHAGSYMNLVHSFFSVGAVIGPFLIGLFLAAAGTWRPVSWIVAVPTLGLLALTVGVRFPKVETDAVDSSEPRRAGEPAAAERRTGDRAAEWLDAVAQRPVVFGALTLMLYVGAEVGLSAWIVHYLTSELGFSTVAASSGLSTLWIGIMVGRFGSSIIARRFSSGLLVSVAGVIGLVSGAALLYTSSPVLVFALLAVEGLAMSGIFPNVMAEINSRDPRRAGAITGFMAVGAGSGAMVFQWLIGAVAQGVDLVVALHLPAVLMGLLVVTYRIALGPSRDVVHSR